MTSLKPVPKKQLLILKMVYVSRPDLRYPFYALFWLGQGVTRVGSLVFNFYVGLVWFPIRGSCLSLSLIGDHI